MRYGLHSHQISLQLNTYMRFWTNVLDRTFHQRHENMNQGNIFWEKHISKRFGQGHVYHYAASPLYFTTVFKHLGKSERSAAGLLGEHRCPIVV